MVGIDIEAVLTALLEIALPQADHVGTDIPAVLAGQLVVHVTSPTGSATDIDDEYLVDVDTFAPTRSGAFLMAREARAAMLGFSATAHNGALIDTVRTATLPSWVDYRNPAVQRFHASYRVVARTHQ